MNSSSRNGARVIWLVLLTTEGIMRATDLRAWTSWPGSSHAASDETGALLTPTEGFVPYERAAWTLRNGNPISENIEQCGFARWTRAEWLARPKLLDATARWLADRSKARGIPLRRLSYGEIRARNVPGVIMHDDYSKATGDGTHWDCGPGYPWDLVLAKATAYASGNNPEEDDLSAEDVKKINDYTNFRINQLASWMRSEVREQVVNRLLEDRGHAAAQDELIRQVAASKGTPIDLDAIRAAARQGTAEAIESIETTVRLEGDSEPPKA